MALGDGQMSWAGVMAGPLAGAMCLSQDLDGLHVGPASAVAPASMLRVWRRDQLLVRLRLDGRTAYGAAHDLAAQPPVATVPWDPAGGRVAGTAGRGPGADCGETGARFEQVVTSDPNPVTSVGPAPDA